MFVTYSLMNASYDSNSLLIVTRSSLRGGSLCLVVLGHRLLPLQIELLEVVFLARHELDPALEEALGLLHRDSRSSLLRRSTTAGCALTTIL